MSALRDMPVGRKLLLHAVVATGVAVFLAGAVAIWLDYRTTRMTTVRDLSIRTDIVAGNLSAAVTFDDPDGAREVLGRLVADPSVIQARVYDAEHKPFAPFQRRGEVLPLPDTAPPAGAYARDDALWMCKAIVLDEETIGWLLVVYDLSDLAAALRRHVTIGLIVLAAAMVVAAALASRLHGAVLGPIVDLAATARRVSRDRDYSLRARRHGRDEIGDLTGAFNEMLGEIEARDEALRRSRDELEERVRERTADLERATRAAQAASEVKSEFLANVSHEIRTPMNAILGYAELLLAGGASPAEEVEFLRTIRRNGEQLLEILNDVLDLSKIEAGRMTVERIECRPARVLLEVAALMRARAREKGLELTVSARGPVPRTIRSDPTRLRQILINLVGNAIKFTDGGFVRLSAGLEEPGPDGARRLRIDVSDSGIGMSADQMAALFQPFTQADSSTTRRFGGTGLGLAISKRLAVQLGGDLTAASESGRGSTFSLVLDPGPLEGVPLDDAIEETAAAAAPVAAHAPRSSLRGVRVLLAEDGADNRHLITVLLSRAGADVETAENGRMAYVRALTAWRGGDPYDVVLMDMQMPELDGYDATVRLREGGYPGPIIALTAHAMAEDRQRCLSAGCTGYLSKPVDPEGLVKAVAAAAVHS